jgi:hypothetical protein
MSLRRGQRAARSWLITNNLSKRPKLTNLVGRLDLLRTGPYVCKRHDSCHLVLQNAISSEETFLLHQWMPLLPSSRWVKREGFFFSVELL